MVVYCDLLLTSMKLGNPTNLQLTGLFLSPSRWHSSPDTATKPTLQQNAPNSAPFQQASQYSHPAALMAPLPASWPSQRSLPISDSSKSANLPSNPSNYPPGKPAPLPPISHTSQVLAPQFTQTLGVTSGQHTLPYPPSSHSTTPTTVPHTHPHHHTPNFSEQYPLHS